MSARSGEVTCIARWLWPLLLTLSPLLADGLNNAALIPPIQPDAEVKLEGISPDWVKSLVIAELRIETATEAGTFASATRVLDHYAEMGVNGLWITPVHERGTKSNGYGNFGPHTIEPQLTGAKDTAGSFEVARRFVSEAHRRNIRVFFDIVAWGTRTDSPLVTEHPEFYKRVGGGFWKIWSGYGFDWEHAGFRAWYRQSAVDFIQKTGADGFRVDLAPDVSAYFFSEVRMELLKQGRKIAIVSEMPGERRDAFDFEQMGVTGWTEEPDYAHPDKLKEQKERFGISWQYLLRNNLVDAVREGRGIGKATLQQNGKGGLYRYYTANLLCHDDTEPAAKGDRVSFAYATLFGPFIPMWWIGEEWNNPKKLLPDPSAGGVLYGNTIDWSVKEQAENTAFFEDIKRYLKIRRSYPQVFENFSARLRDANIVKVDSSLDGMPNSLQAYGRTAPGMAVVIVPNAGPRTAELRVSMDPAALGIPGVLEVTDLISGHPVLLEDRGSFHAVIQSRHLGVYLVRSSS